MNCPECQEFLHKRLDGEQFATDALDQHLIKCASCREQHAAALRLLEGIRLLPSAEAPANLARSIVAGVMHERRQRQDKVRRRIVVTMALAASVLLMLWAGYYWRPVNQEPPPKQDFTDIKKPEVMPPKDPVKPKEIDRPESPHAFSALQARLADTTLEHAKVVLVAANLDGMDKLPAVSELPADPNVQEVSDGVRSVTRNARKAFDFFARELPMPDVGEQK